MKTKFISIAATLLLAASFNTASATYYLVGPDHNWTPANGIEFTGNTLTTTYSGEFKIVDVQGDNALWYGADAVGHYELNCINNTANLTDRGGAPNLYLKNSLKYTFTFDSDSKVLTVTGFSNDGFFITGDFNNWKPEEMTKNSDGTFSIVKHIYNYQLIKFRDSSGNWYGGNTGKGESNNDPYGISNQWSSYVPLTEGNLGKNFQINCNEGNYTFIVTEDQKLIVGGYNSLLTLNDAGNDNTTAISTNNENTLDVVLQGRTLYGGVWNTLCLPFSVNDHSSDDNKSFSATPLEGAVVKTLTESKLTNDGILELTFGADLTSIDAGQPLIVKPVSDVNYVRFNGVQISNIEPQSVGDDFVFEGCFNTKPIQGSDYLYLGAENKLYWPTGNVTIGAFRAYFKQNLPEGSLVKSFVLNFGDDNEETSIKQITNTETPTNTYFTLDGRRLNEKPATAGLYIINGKKVVIK